MPGIRTHRKLGVQQGTLLNQNEAQYQTVVDAMTVKPSATLETLQNNFVKTLVDAGIWVKGDRLYVMDNHTNANGEALLNWINPTQSAINQGAVHDPYYGFVPNGSNTYINLVFNPTTAGQKFAQNDATILAYSRKNIILDEGIQISTIGVGVKHCGQYVSSGKLNSVTAPVMTSDTTNAGFIAQTRNSATTQYSYSNSLNFTSTANSTTPPNGSLFWGGRNQSTEGSLGTASNAPLSVFFVGSYLSADEIAIFRTAINTYINGIDVAFKILSSAIATVATATKQKLTIPTYVESNDEVVHPSIVNCGAEWNGYQYWMAITPYPSSNDDYENPEIYCSSDGLNWIVPVGGSNPVFPYPGAYHNADPNLLFDNNKLYLSWLEFTATNIIVYLSESTDGITWSAKQQIITEDDNYYSSGIQCPSIIKAGSTYYIYYTAKQVSGVQQFALMRRSASSIGGTYSAIPTNIYFERPPTANWDWGHQNIQYYNGKYYLLAATSTSAILNGKGDYIYIGISDDGIHFKKYDSPLISKTETIESKFYLPTFCTVGDKVYVYYSIYSNVNKWELMTAEIEILQ